MKNRASTQAIIDEMCNPEMDHLHDSNTPTRRFFRCYIDGSYLVFDDYKHNCDYVRRHYNSDKKLRSFVIAKFASYMAHDNNCKPQTALNAIKKAWPIARLEQLNIELIDDARDLVREEFETA